MTSKEALERICLHCEHYHQDMCFRAIAGCEEWHKLEKDLEEKELLESELKLEKDKVKYLMKQLKNQDEILSILKPYFRGAVFPSAINFNFSDKNWEPIKEWLDDN